MKKDFYIFGLQRSGTTYVEKCLTTNFDMQVVNGPGSWKHRWPIPTEFPNHQESIKFVVTKNPYTWVESIIYRGSADLLETHGKRFLF